MSVPLFRGYAPLSTFSAKIELCYAMGFISKKLYRSLTLVRKLRNDFAHEKHGVSFQEPKYRQRFLAILAGCERGSSGDSEVRTPEEEMDDAKPVRHLGMTRGQLVDRLAFCLGVSRMVGGIQGRRATFEDLVQLKLALADEFDNKNTG